MLKCAVSSFLHQLIYIYFCCSGWWSRSATKTPWKKSLQKCDTDENQWEIMTTNRSGWRHAVCKGTEAFENTRQSSQQVKCAAMKARTITAERSTECPVCSCLCASDFGLTSHMQAHKQTKCLVGLYRPQQSTTEWMVEQICGWGKECGPDGRVGDKTGTTRQLVAGYGQQEEEWEMRLGLPDSW